ncbi:HAMP domain-containing protein [Luteolibacter ambystomatis]|uniref:histidine kinase n=1 Tax=Luteolibacter ambystomatis TaxID=2824561 RepID=A0A975PGZ3_9BACT|nr:ATP-binding protein [Luteolibacter ambystomatis]QUE53243.1 HAMP domain-containing protein [Luteolibacter ambystomatis]
MKVRTRLTLWFAGLLLGSLLLLGGLLHYELVDEVANGHKPESPSEKIEDLLLSYGLPTIAILVIGGSWLVRRALRPVEQLAAAAERVHAGHLAERIPLSGRGDELDRLAEAFNRMLGRVDAGISSVRDFTLRASHELKTPLTILSAETELALGGPTATPAQRERLASQYEEIQRLTALVNALGLLAKADAGLPTLARENLRLDDLLREAVDNIRPLAAMRGITVNLETCDPAPMHADRSSLRQILLNLLDNAVKHNQPDGWIAIRLRHGSVGTDLAIENSGPPIPPAILPKVFDRFVRGPGVVEGSGLGLSIVRTLVEAHGGRVFCEPGRSHGFCIEMKLPTQLERRDGCCFVSPYRPANL